VTNNDVDVATRGPSIDVAAVSSVTTTTTVHRRHDRGVDD